MNFKHFLPLALLMCGLSAEAQTSLDWHLSTFNPIDSLFGARITEAYSMLPKKSKPVTVAVISRGFDVEHEDLKDVLWTNPKEKPDNGKDDDKNGYIDDIHGWNFLGKADGTNITYTREEASRQFDKVRTRFEQLNALGKKRTDAENKELMSYMNLAKNSQAERLYMSMIFAKNIGVQMEELDRRLHKMFPKDSDFTFEQFQKLAPQGAEARDSINSMGFWVNAITWSFSANEKWSKRFAHRYDTYEKNKQAYEAAKAKVKDERAEVGDNLDDLDDNHYGNNQLLAGNPTVGTGLAGIIGARRGNGIGIDGVADNVRLMMVRAVPEGEAYDKDIANAIRYAVNNGAEIILLASAKPLSDRQDFLNLAIAEAEKKGVLIVHGAGDTGNNIDNAPTSPSPVAADGHRFANFINVAASDADGDPFRLADYGKKNVDVFAPGVNIYTCDTGDNYLRLTGSNAAAAVVAGVVALYKSRYPKLTAAQLRQFIIDGARQKPLTLVTQPSNAETADNQKPVECGYADLCVSGGILDAVGTLKLIQKSAK